MIIPITIPPKMSVGKCTYRYNLEKAIRAVIGITIIPHFFLYNVITVAAIVEDNACPDGNE